MIVRTNQYGDLLTDLIGTVGTLLGGSKPAPPPPPPPKPFFETDMGVAVLAIGGVVTLGTLFLVLKKPTRTMQGYRKRRHRR